MALKYPETSERKWIAQLSALAGGLSDPQVIPGFVDDLVATVKPGVGGNAALEFTTDDEDTIDTDPGSVTWLTWAAGFNAFNVAQTALGAVTGVRLSAIAANATCSLVGNKRTIRR